MQLVLTENRHLRIASFTIFYVAQGLPIGLLMIAIPCMVGRRGRDSNRNRLLRIPRLVCLGALSFSQGPIMDRFSYLSMGRRRPWVVLSQSGLLLALFSMSLTPDPIDSVWLLSTMAFLVNMFAAVQDVAVDGMAIDVLEPDERGSANAFMACGQVVGFSGSGFVTAHALEYGGLALACFIVAFGVAFILLWSILIKERSMEKRLPWTQGEPAPRSIEIQAGSWREIFANLIRVMFLPTSLILMTTALCWGMTQGVWESSAPVILTQELGYESTCLLLAGFPR
jgi:PAT family beta-lactamase induction signal transducer AmpG